MKFYFEDIENGSVEGAGVLDVEENGVKVSKVHNLVIEIINHVGEVPNDAPALILLAAQHGGVETPPEVLPIFSVEPEIIDFPPDRAVFGSKKAGK